MASNNSLHFITLLFSTFFFLLLSHSSSRSLHLHSLSSTPHQDAINMAPPSPPDNPYNTIHVPPHQHHQKRRRSPVLSSHRTSFNDSDHEVPSGPNPISNR
ncbi:hypothetical protein QN277_019409 [Acacia crassicarpa]|uniref:Transmembrane protein n=1 Tax=Acacia crassicarpa TaxID=499986 RepID=A0AAE1MRT6_9FABA|nr:hypothetical protein QN277_019409 [Acacia crassicarpa]